MSPDDTRGHEAAPEQPSAPPPSDYREVLREQWGHAVETSRYIMGLAVQSFGFLIAADALLMGYGLTRDEPKVLWVAAFLPLFMAAVAFLTRNALGRFVATGIWTEHELGLGENGLMGQFSAGPSRHQQPGSKIGGYKIRFLIIGGAVFQFALALVFTIRG